MQVLAKRRSPRRGSQPTAARDRFIRCADWSRAASNDRSRPPAVGAVLRIASVSTLSANECALFVAPEP